MVDVAALESIGLVRDLYQVRVDKPCVAWLLAGNPPTASRWKVAFTLAADLRGGGVDQPTVERVIRKWALRIGWSPREAHRAVAGAFRTKPNGEFVYHPPGITKKPGTHHHEVLNDLCAAIGCPNQCPAFAGTRRGQRAETYQRFVALGWPERLGRLRYRLAAETYRAICTREAELGFAPGAPLHTSHEQLARLGQLDRKTVARHLHALALLGLIHYQPGCGEKNQRRASKIQRVTPIPATGHALPIPPIRTGDTTPPDIGDVPTVTEAAPR